MTTRLMMTGAGQILSGKLRSSRGGTGLKGGCADTLDLPGKSPDSV
jgi:hypothetical protein